MPHRSRLCHFVIDVDDLDGGVAFWSAALDAQEEQLGEGSRRVYRRLRLPHSDLRVLLQLTQDSKTTKERMHLDIETTILMLKWVVSNTSEPPGGITSKNVAMTSGCSATPGQRVLRT